jgi:predicted CXXCH cytochrome family protein
MCHTDKQTYAFVHGPVGAGDCTVCHNPHESSHRALTLKAGSELCADCHTDIEAEMKKKIVHPPVQDGCTACHNPHGSPYKKLLTADGERLCFQCHPDVGETVEKGKSIHAPIKTEKGCMACHAPHASDGRNLLQKEGKDLCLECHRDVIKKNYSVLHGPIKEGNCTVCHNPHASAYDKLLGKSFPDDIYGSYSDKEYELCFTCHKRDLVRFPDTSFATGFRDGERNLHYVHVTKKEKGRSCKACHTPHGGGLPKLMADKVKFGKWELPLNFVQTDTGGSCAPGCHKKYAYDRRSAAKEEEILLQQGKRTTGEETMKK